MASAVGSRRGWRCGPHGLILMWRSSRWSWRRPTGALRAETLTQSIDRSFSAGAADSVEVVKSEESLAAAGMTMMAAISAALAQVSLVRPWAKRRKTFRQFLKGANNDDGRRKNKGCCPFHGRAAHREIWSLTALKLRTCGLPRPIAPADLRRLGRSADPRRGHWHGFSTAAPMSPPTTRR